MYLHKRSINNNILEIPFSAKPLFIIEPIKKGRQINNIFGNVGRIFILGGRSLEKLRI